LNWHRDIITNNQQNEGFRSGTNYSRLAMGETGLQ